MSRSWQDPIAAEAVVDGHRWHVVLVPLESVRVTCDGVETHATWDRQTLFGRLSKPIPRELSVALRRAIDEAER